MRALRGAGFAAKVVLFVCILCASNEVGLFGSRQDADRIAANLNQALENFRSSESLISFFDKVSQKLLSIKL
jgi:hypothetical protein